MRCKVDARQDAMGWRGAWRVPRESAGGEKEGRDKSTVLVLVTMCWTALDAPRIASKPAIQPHIASHRRIAFCALCCDPLCADLDWN